MAKNKKSVSKSIPASSDVAVSQGIYGLNASKLSIKKSRKFIPGSELTGTVK
jgi:hypothetical protein